MKPTHRLKVLNKVTYERAIVGAGWQNEDGSISIVLDICVTLQRDPNIVMTLFPIASKNTP